MDLSARIDRLEQMVKQAKTMPLSSSVLLNRDEVQQMVTDMRESLPEEIQQARWVVRDREELLAKARSEGDAIVEQARAEQLHLAEQEEIVRRAHEEAARILAEAQDEVRQARSDAEDYVDARLRQVEEAMAKVLRDLREIEAGVDRTAKHIGRGREVLRESAADADVVDTTAGDAPDSAEPFDEEARL